MTITRVQTAQGGADGNPGSPVTAVFGSNVTAGNLIVVFTRNGDSYTTGITKTGTASVTFSLVAQEVPITNDIWIDCYWGVVTGTGSCTVSAAFASTNYVWVEAIEVNSDVAVTWAVDDSAINWDSGVTDITVTGVTTTVNDAYMALGVGQASLATYTAGTDFTLVDGTIPHNPNDFGGVEERILTSTISSYTAHITSSGASQFSAVVGVFSATPAASSQPWLYRPHTRIV